MAWAVFQPLAAMAVFTLVFGHFVGVPSDGVPYAVFVFSGLTIWWYISNTVEAASESLIEHRDLVTKVYFPRILAPLASALPGLIDLAVTLVVVAVLMAAYRIEPGLQLVLVPAWISAAVIVAIAAGLWLSALNVLYRDVRYVVPFLLQLWLFASPVVYPSSIVRGGWRYVYYANPVAGLLDGFRWSLVAAPAPPAIALLSLLTGLVVLLSGFVYFAQTQRRLADVI